VHFNSTANSIKNKKPVIDRLSFYLAFTQMQNAFMP